MLIYLQAMIIVFVAVAALCMLGVSMKKVLHLNNTIPIFFKNESFFEMENSGPVLSNPSQLPVEFKYMSNDTELFFKAEKVG